MARELVANNWHSNEKPSSNRTNVGLLALFSGIKNLHKLLNPGPNNDSSPEELFEGEMNDVASMVRRRAQAAVSTELDNRGGAEHVMRKLHGIRFNSADEMALNLVARAVDFHVSRIGKMNAESAEIEVSLKGINITVRYLIDSLLSSVKKESLVSENSK